MSRLFVGLLGSAFAFGSVAAMADDNTHAQPVGQAKQYNGNDPYGTTPAKTPEGTPLIGGFGRMTPAEKAAARKTARAKKQQEASAIAKEADTGKMAQQQKDEADPAGAKAQPKALPPARPPMGVPVDRRYLEPLPPGGPAQREPAKSNP
ncbi:MAG TPA: hypothetical protein VGL29_16415 [Blastocatellia bacterium]|jgi:hypothetical protein